MKKKYISVILSLFLLGMTGCGNKEAASTIEEPTVIENTVVEESTEIESTVTEESTDIESTVVEETTEPETTEVEGGDGEDTTEISEEATPQSEVAENKTEEFEPYIMYTNTACNIRDRASKDGILVGTYPVNTKIEVIGEENGWSKFIYDDGGWAFIKSSLLSKTQVAGKAVTTPKQETDSTPAQQPTPQPTPQPQASADTSQFPPDVASSPYLSRYLGLGLSTEEIIAAVRDDEQAIIFDGTETYAPNYGVTDEDRARIAELSKNVVVE